jgi:hypothetical protein
MIRDLARFRSNRFAPVLPDECQVNPGCYGAELAFWPCTGLYQEHRIVTSYPDCEDWGWLLSYTAAEDSEFAIYCGNINGSNDYWLISLRRYRQGFLWREKPSFMCAGVLIAALRSILEAEDGIRELNWLWVDGE